MSAILYGNGTVKSLEKILNERHLRIFRTHTQGIAQLYFNSPLLFHRFNHVYLVMFTKWKIVPIENGSLPEKMFDAINFKIMET